jgi:putative ABC transport system permease protein
VIANLVVWPFVYFGARAYLRQFFEPIPLTPLPFVAALLITLAIAWLAVGGQTWRAAQRKPAAVLRRE